MAYPPMRVPQMRPAPTTLCGVASNTRVDFSSGEVPLVGAADSGIADKEADMPVTGKCPWWLRVVAGGLYYEVDEALVGEVQLIYVAYLNGSSTKQIAEERNAAGKASVPKGQRRHWTERGISDLLRNRAVAGVRITQRKANASQQHVEADYFPQIVAPEDFDGVQQLLDAARTQGGGNANGSNLFKGLCTCACGKPVYAYDAERVRSPRQDGWASGELRCSDPACVASTRIPAHRLEAPILLAVMGIASYDLAAKQTLRPCAPYLAKERAELRRLSEALRQVPLDELRDRLGAVADAVESARDVGPLAGPPDSPWGEADAEQLRDLLFELWDKPDSNDKRSREEVRARLQRGIRKLDTRVVLRKARKSDYPRNASNIGLCEVQWRLGVEMQKEAFPHRVPNVLDHAARVELRIWTEPADSDSDRDLLTKVQVKQIWAAPFSLGECELPQPTRPAPPRDHGIRSSQRQSRGAYRRH